MELLHYWKVLQRSLWIIILLVVVIMSAATAYTLKQPAEYDSSAVLLLNPAAAAAFVTSGDPQVGQTLADSYSELMRSQSFAASVSKESPFPISIGRVRTAVTTKLVVNTFFFKITSRMDQPDKAQQLTKAVVKVFLANGAAVQGNGSGTGGDSVKNDMRLRLETKLKDTTAQIKSYQDEINGLQAQPGSTARDDRLLALRNQLIIIRQDETATLAAIATIGSVSAPAQIATVIDEPLAGKQVPTGLSSNLGLGLAVSLVLGLGLAFLRDYLDSSVSSAEQLEDLLGLHAMGVIGMQGGSRRRGLLSRRRKAQKGAGDLARHSLVTLENPNSDESEDFRVLRTNIQFSSLERPIQSLEVTSSGPNEGKSFIASNLAVVMAQASKRVILVDADLRKPSLHEIFGLPNEVGFTDLVMAGSNGVAGAVQPVPGVNNLAVITSGSLPPNPSELLNSRQAAKVIEQLTQQTDILIFDCAPTAVTDPIILATRVDAVLLVISAASTRRDLVARARQSLENVGVLALLPVLNRVATRGTQGLGNYRRYGGTPRAATSNGRGHHANGKAAAQPAGVDATATSSQSTIANGR